MRSHTGPVIFADKTARNQLTTHGEVVPFRTTERTTGKTWWRSAQYEIGMTDSEETDE